MADEAKETPTATEFIPADEISPNRTGKPMVRGLQLVREGRGIEVTYREPYDDEVRNHVFVCDECGQSESLGSDMEFHLRTQHRDT